MKTWKNQIKTPQGFFTVKEANDGESTSHIAPFSHGFVNMYSDDVWKSWCGSHYAECLQVDSAGNYLNRKDAMEMLAQARRWTKSRR